MFSDRQHIDLLAIFMILFGDINIKCLTDTLGIGAKLERWQQVSFAIPLYLDCCWCCWVAKSCLTLWTPWTVDCQAPLSMRFSKQEHWSELPFPSPEDLPDPGIELSSPALVRRFFTQERILYTGKNILKLYL